MTTYTLLADIGGTHIRFALLDATDAASLAHFEPQHLYLGRTADHANLAQALDAYRVQLKLAGKGFDRAVLAVAAPLSGDWVQMVNAPWQFSIAHMQAQFGLQSLHVINDFEALALAVPHLQSWDCIALDSHKPSTCATISANAAARLNKAIIGPGTGLGMAGVVWQGQRWQAIASEAGHAGVAAANAHEIELLKAALVLRQRPICWEDFVSGTGLPLLHQAQCLVEAAPYQALSAAQIASAANQHDAICSATIHHFCSLLGRIAGDLALFFTARGGVYLTGGVLQHLASYLPQSPFREAFEDKGDYRAYMQGIATHLITRPQLALLGCAAHAKMRDTSA